MAGQSGIRLTLEGFDELLKNIEAAGRSIDSACESCMKQSAKTMDTIMREQLSAATESGLASRMPSPRIEKVGVRYYAHVGFEKDEYDPKNLSDAYKAMFLNYGTPHRQKHGQVKARGWIKKSKAKGKRILKKQQEETLKKILERAQR